MRKYYLLGQTKHKDDDDAAEWVLLGALDELAAINEITDDPDMQEHMEFMVIQGERVEE